MKKRLDVLIVELGLAPTRQKAHALIMSGVVLVDDFPVDKPGARIKSSSSVRFKAGASLGQLKYVGRGGLKIEGALSHFQIDPKNKVAIDIGASTGGFTDCLLQQGASSVYAVDVGYNQLALSLRNDHRVVVMERTHILNMCSESFTAETPTFAVVDVSFIGLQKILPAIVSLLASPKELLVLVKPQF